MTENVEEFLGINWERYIARELGELGYEAVNRHE
jgi:hypothetical protein